MQISPTKGVMRFGRKDKLSLKLIGPYSILERIDTVACRLELPINVDKVHDVYTVSQLRRYIRDSTSTPDLEMIDLDETMILKEKTVKILDSKVRKTRNRKAEQVKVLWSNDRNKKVT